MKELLAVLRTRNLALLLSGRLVSSTGDWFYTIALSVVIYGYSHGNTVYVGLLWIVRLIPGLVLGPFAGALADRMGYRRAMIAADLGRGLITAVLALALNQSDWPIIYPLAFTFTTFGNLFAPASVAIIPSLVRVPSERLAANAAFMEADSIAMILGSALGGIIAEQGFISQMLWIEAATFVVSLMTLWGLRLGTPLTGDESEGEEEAEDSIGVVAGFRLLATRPLLVFAALIMAVPELASGADTVWVVPFSEKVLHLGNGGIGYLYAALGIGCLLGGVVATALGGTIRLDQLLGGSVALGGVALALFGSWHVAAAALFFFLVVGLAETLEFVAFETLLQQAVPESMIGQASGSMDSLFVNMMLIGTVLSGPLVIWPGLTASLVGLGVLTVVITGGASFYLRAQLAGQPEPAVLAQIPAFAGLTLGVREWAIRRMVREQFPKDAIIIRQGDEGDKFYTIAKGLVRVEITSNGRSMTTELGPGSFFGEIALLQQVPRTATVRALKPVTLYSMSREDFEELRSRSGDLNRSLLEAAASRMEVVTAFSLSPASRA
ncbi:MAG TPA: MFS transporter [Chloroflexota bacterium]